MNSSASPGCPSHLLKSEITELEAKKCEYTLMIIDLCSFIIYGFNDFGNYPEKYNDTGKSTRLVPMPKSPLEYQMAA